MPSLIWINPPLLWRWPGTATKVCSFPLEVGNALPWPTRWVWSTGSSTGKGGRWRPRGLTPAEGRHRGAQ